MPAIARDHSRQDRVGHRHQTFDVGVDHLLPVVEIGALGRLEAAREPGVVDQQIDRGQLRREPGDRALDRGAVPHVERQRQRDRVAELGRERREPLGAAADGDDAVATRREAASNRDAESRGGASDEDDHE